MAFSTDFLEILAVAVLLFPFLASTVISAVTGKSEPLSVLASVTLLSSLDLLFSFISVFLLLAPPDEEPPPVLPSVPPDGTTPPEPPLPFDLKLAVTVTPFAGIVKLVSLAEASAKTTPSEPVQPVNV